MTKEAWKTIVSWVVVVVVLLSLPLGTLAYVSQDGGGAKDCVYVVVPHPDDEFQAWSLIENKSSEYKVFVSLTRGEGTRFCEPENMEEALQEDLGEVRPYPSPAGKRTPSCEMARSASLIGFLEQMSLTDDTIPGDFGSMKTYAVQHEGDVEPCRPDSVKEGEQDCSATAREVRVWLDQEGRGAVLVFNLGDGDLSQEEAQWAVEAVLEEGHEWGIPSGGLPPTLIAGFSNYDSDKCYRYKHGDHYATERALYDVDYGVGAQLGATCFADPRRSLTAVVSSKAVRAAFQVEEDGQRTGAHGVHYGWLHAETYPIAHWRQSSLFHRIQSFWVRFG